MRSAWRYLSALTNSVCFPPAVAIHTFQNGRFLCLPLQFSVQGKASQRLHTFTPERWPYFVRLIGADQYSSYVNIHQTFQKAEHARLCSG